MIIGETALPEGPLGVDAVAVTMKFGDFLALDNVALKVRPGSFTRCSARTAREKARW